MSAFQAATPAMKKLDPLKRVNYTFGLVLGVDEFQQEQGYLIAKDRSQYSLAHGYGTICGLRILVNQSTTQVSVAPGIAIDPQGHEIRVRREMCAPLNDWLTSNRKALHDLLGTPPVTVPLCVVLCYRECPTDLVPVPGAPCRTQQDTMAASHIAESFQVKFCVDERQVTGSPAPGAGTLCFRPDQVEEDAIRQVGRFLRRIRVSANAADFATREDVEELMRQLAAVDNGAIFSPPDAPIFLRPEEADEILRAAMLVWVTEVRPVLGAGGGSCDCHPPAEQCVLLAELSVPVNSAWRVAGNVGIDESHRPYLIQTRLLQECLLSAAGSLGSGSGAGAVVAAGFFHIQANHASAAGSTYNGLTASSPAGLATGSFLLDWSGLPGYMNPLAASPPAHTYVVTGAVMVPDAAPARAVFELVRFSDDGIVVRVLDTQGHLTATGFSVEIRELGVM